MRTVAFVQRRLPHYRLPLFSALAEKAAEAGLAMTFYSSEPPDARISARFPYCVCAPIRLGTGGAAPYWMKGLSQAVAGADIIIAPQEMRCLSVIWLWLRRRSICGNWIWFGHGYNTKLRLRPGGRYSITEFVREFVTPRSSGIITYTPSGAEHWRRRGLSEKRAQAFWNTIDVEGFRSHYTQAKRQARQFRQDFDLEGKVVLLYCGRIYKNKRLGLLIDAFRILRERNPQTSLLIVGDGEERAKIEDGIGEGLREEIHFFGEIVAPEALSVYFAAADSLVIPGVVGLAIVQGFAFGLPLATTDVGGHGPEIDYLTADTGIVTRPEPSSYAAGIEAVVRSPGRLKQMKKAAWAKGTQLSLEATVNRFIAATKALSNGN